MPTLADHDLNSLRADLSAAGHKPVHALAVLRHFYESAGHPQLDTIEISKGVVQHIDSQFSPRSSRIAAKSVAGDGTTKLLIALDGGGSVETVLMPGFRAGVAAGCVSSQIGCAMGCDFCASALSGFERNLSAGEIVEQFLHLKELAGSMDRRLKTLVFMGMGEPLLNFDAVVAAIRRIADPGLGGLGWRQITVSTVGVIPGIDRLADADLNVHLAVSLHAPDDATRSKLVPMNRRFNVADILAAARRFLDRTHRVPTIEYCLLAGVNDFDEQALLLAQLMRGFRAHVNLIPYNPIGAGLSGRSYARPSEDRMNTFINLLRDNGVVAHFRLPRGDDVNAACGQLRNAVGATVVR
jgi:23S rRNA (adenine2503-C2)-methyltransferase